jgi:hypothetical protein
MQTAGGMFVDDEEPTGRAGIGPRRPCGLGSSFECSLGPVRAEWIGFGMGHQLKTVVESAGGEERCVSPKITEQPRPA